MTLRLTDEQNSALEILAKAQGISKNEGAVLLESIVRNDPLVDGNKKLGWIASVMFLERNGRRVDAPDGPAYDLVIAVSTGSMSYQESAARLAAWTSTST